MNRYFVPQRPAVPTKEDALIQQLTGEQKPQVIDQGALVAKQKLSKPNASLSSIGKNAIAQGSSTAPVQSVGEGIARALQGAVGGYIEKQSASQQSAYDEAKSKAIADALAGGKTGTEFVNTLRNAGFADEAAQYAQKSLDEQAKTASALQLEEGKYKLGTEYKPELARLTIEAETPAKVAQTQALNPVEAQGALMKAAATSPYDIANSRAGAPTTNVQIANNTAENFSTSAGKELGKLNAQDYAKKQQQAVIDQVQLPKLQTQLALLNNGTNQGFGADFILQTRKLLRSAGLDDGKNLSDAEVLNSLSNDAVTAELRKNVGAQTNTDYSNQLKSAISLSKERETNIRLTKQQINEINQRNDAFRQYAEQFSKSVTQNDPIAMFNAPNNALSNTPAPASSLNAPVQSPLGALKRNPDGSYSYGF